MTRRSRNSLNKLQTKRRNYWPFSSSLQSRYGTRASTALSRNGRLACSVAWAEPKLTVTHADADDRKRAESGRTSPSSIRAAKKSNGNKRRSRPENQSVVLALANRIGGGDSDGDDDFMPTKKAATAAKACSKPVAPAGGTSRARPKAKKESDDDEDGMSFDDE